MGIAPSEFWSMRPRHFWYLVAAKTQVAPKSGSKLTASDAKRLRKMMDAHNLRVQKEQAADG